MAKTNEKSDEENTVIIIGSLIFGISIILLLKSISASAQTTKLINVSDFNIRASCPRSTEFPIVDIIRNSITIPFASNNPNCLINYLDAIGITAYTLHSFSFSGIFYGGNNAPSGSEEMAVFVTNDKITFNGKEFGFVYTNNDKTLKGYAQGQDLNPSYQYVVLDNNPDGLEHKYTTRIVNNNPLTIEWLIDDKLIKSKIINVNSTYYDIPYYIVCTTHRNLQGWNSNGYYIGVRNIYIN